MASFQLNESKTMRRFTLDDCPLLAPESRRRLRLMGLEYLDQLLDELGPSNTRGRIANQVGIPISELDRAVTFADLIRAEGVGAQTAMLLVEGGIGCTRDFAHVDAARLRDQLNTLNDKLDIVRSRLSLADVEQIQRSAKHIQPAYERFPMEEAGLRAVIKSASRISQVGWIVVVVGAFSTYAAIGMDYQNLILPFARSIQDSPLSDERTVLAFHYFQSFGVAMLMVLGVLTVSGLLTILLWENLAKFLRGPLRRLLFRSRNDQEYLYASITRPRGLVDWVCDALMVLGVIVVGIVSIRLVQMESSSLAVTDALNWLLPSLTLIAMVPSVALIARPSPELTRFGWTETWKLFQWQLSWLSSSVLCLAFLFAIAIPTGLSWYRQQFAPLVGQSYAQGLHEARAVLVSARDSIAPELGIVVDSVIASRVAEGTPLILLHGLTGEAIEQSAVRHLRRVTLIAVGVALALSCLLPLLFHQPIRAIIKLSILAGGFLLGKILEAGVSSFTKDEPNSAIAAIVLIIVVLATTTASDTIEGMLSQAFERRSKPRRR
jgi:hypothetical protein